VVTLLRSQSYGHRRQRDGHRGGQSVHFLVIVASLLHGESSRHRGQSSGHCGQSSS